MSSIKLFNFSEQEEYKHALLLYPFRIFYNSSDDKKSPQILEFTKNREIPDYILQILESFYKAYALFIQEQHLKSPMHEGIFFDKGAKFIDIMLADIPLQKGLVAAELIDNQHYFEAIQNLHGKSIKILLDRNLILNRATPIHELFYVFQYNYSNFNNMWFMEGLARWSQNIIHKRANIEEKLPSSVEELRSLILRAHDAEYFWRRLISKCDNKIDFIKILLEQSALQAVELEKKFNLTEWSREDKKSSSNNSYLFKAIVKTVEILQIKPDEELQSFLESMKEYKNLIRDGDIHFSYLSKKELQELESVEEIQGELLIDSTSLSTLNSFNRLKKVTTIKIKNNLNLVEILGFNALESIQNLEISHNVNLENIYGFFKFFTTVQKINGYIKIESNKKLETLLFLRGLTHVGSSFYLHHNHLTSLQGLEDLEEVGASLSLSSNQLRDLSPLKNLKRVKGMLGVAFNQLTTLEGLENLKELSTIKWGQEYRTLAIQGNKELMDISALRDVQSSTKHCIMNLDRSNNYKRVPEENSQFYKQSISLTSNGSAVETQDIFPRYQQTKIKILFADTWVNALSKIDWLDAHFSEFKDVNRVIEYAKKHGIIYIYGQVYNAQKFLFHNKEGLKKADLKFLVNDFEVVKLLLDKRRFFEFMIENNLEIYIPKYYKNSNEICYPCVIKHINGANGDTVRIVYSKEELGVVDKDEVVNEYVLGDTEYAMNLFYKDGNIIEEVTYKKTYSEKFYVLNRETKYKMIDTKIINPYLDEFKEIIRCIVPHATELLCCIDYKVQDNRPKIFEINVRLGYTLARNGDDFKKIMDKYILETEK